MVNLVILQYTSNNKQKDLSSVSLMG